MKGLTRSLSTLGRATTLSILLVATPAWPMVLPGVEGHVDLGNIDNYSSCAATPWPGQLATIKRGNCVVKAAGTCEWTGGVCHCDFEVVQVVSGSDCWDIDFKGWWDVL